MLKSILIGLEDSAGTERATELGFALAKTHGEIGRASCRERV